MGPKILFHSLSQKIISVLAVIVMMFAALPSLPSYAAGSITVNTTTDENTSNGSCSLREAIIAANNNAAYNGCSYSGTGPDDVITLQSGATYPLTLTGASSTTGDLDIGNAGGTSGNLTITVSGGTNAIIDASAIVNRVIEVGATGDPSLTLDHITVTNGQASPGAGILFGGNGTLTLNNSTVSNNTADSPQNCGAGIFNNTTANINIINSTIEGNTCTDMSADGGGLFKGTGGTLTVTASTFNNNTTPDDGGGIRILMPTGTVTVTNSTFANNTAARGGGIQVEGGTVTIAYSTFSGNAANITPGPNTGGAVQAAAGTVEIANSILANSTTNAAVGKDCDQVSPGTIHLTSSLVENNNDCTGTGNLTSDPQLGSLQDNGGPTKTLALGASSPAIDASNDASCPSTDQRGVTRPQGSHCDIGAYEYEAAPPVSWTLTVNKNGPGSGTVTSNPAGIDCGADCSEVYADNTQVTLSAAPAANSFFAGWSGACTGTGSCVVNMTADKTVIATFKLKEFNLVSQWTSDFSSAGQGWQVARHVRVLGDVNGDGKDDVVGFFDDGVWVGRSNAGGTAFNAKSQWSTGFSYNQGWRVDQHVRTVGDVNGDGKDDVVGFFTDGVWVALSNGSSFGSSSKWSSQFTFNQGWRVDQHPLTVGDVNGDGKDDLIGFGYDGVWVALSNGSGFDPYSKWGTSFTYNQGWRIAQHPRLAADANGDGNADLIGFGNDGVWVALSNGSSFAPYSKWGTSFTYNQGWRVDQHPRTAADVNGDGNADLIGFGYDGVWVALSNGSGFAPYSKWSSQFTFNQGWRVEQHPRMAGDVSGDGQADLVGFGNNGVWVATAK